MSLTRIVVFLAVVGGLTALLHRYLWIRLVRDVGWSPPMHRALTITLVSLALLVGFAVPFGRFLPRAVARPIAFAGYTWMGLMFLLFVFLGVGDLVRPIALRVLESGGALDPERRSFLARAIASVASIGAFAAGGFGVLDVLLNLRTTKVSVAIRDLPKSTAGLRIVQMSDIHVGPTIGRDFIETLVERANALNPDVIVITGDLVDGSVADLREHTAPLAKLKAKHGVFFVTGNHEYYSGADAWIAELGRLGVRVLRNERVEIRTGDGPDDAIDLAGIDDASAHQFGGDHGADLARALSGRNPRRPVVLLAHQPRQIDEAIAHGVALQLSGHTHGGQIWPFSLLVKLQQPFVSGLHRRGDTQIYVSPGTGYWGPPMRVGAPAEVTEITLTVA